MQNTQLGSDLETVEPLHILTLKQHVWISKEYLDHFFKVEIFAVQAQNADVLYMSMLVRVQRKEKKKTKKHPVFIPSKGLHILFQTVTLTPR